MLNIALDCEYDYYFLVIIVEMIIFAQLKLLTTRKGSKNLA